jgi:hypothetical protein
MATGLSPVENTGRRGDSTYKIPAVKKAAMLIIINRFNDLARHIQMKFMRFVPPCPSFITYVFAGQAIMNKNGETGK